LWITRSQIAGKESPLPWWEKARVRGNRTFPFHPHLTSSPIKGEENFFGKDQIINDNYNAVLFFQFITHN